MLNLMAPLLLVQELDREAVLPQCKMRWSQYLNCKILHGGGGGGAFAALTKLQWKLSNAFIAIEVFFSLKSSEDPKRGSLPQIGTRFG